METVGCTEVQAGLVRAGVCAVADISDFVLVTTDIRDGEPTLLETVDCGIGSDDGATDSCHTVYGVIVGGAVSKRVEKVFSTVDNVYTGPAHAEASGSVAKYEDTKNIEANG